MLSPVLLRRIRRIELHTRRLVHNAFAGAYHSVFKGQGLAFESVRPYQPGDDVRSIDWKVTARTGQPFVKYFVEERELTVLLLVDGSPSVFFGTADQQKRDFAAELGAVLAYSAIFNNDKIGLLIFSDQIEHYIPPGKSRQHVLRLIRDLLVFKSSGHGTDLARALRTVNRAIKPGAIIFLLSDFMLPTHSYHRDLLATSKIHDVIAVVLRDPLEENWPEIGLVSVEDAETGQRQWVDTQSSAWQANFRQRRRAFQIARDKSLRRAGVSRIDIETGGDYVDALIQFFWQQASQRRRG